MKKIYSSALVMLLLVSVFTRGRIAKGQIFEKDQPSLGQSSFRVNFLSNSDPMSRKKP